MTHKNSKCTMYLLKYAAIVFLTFTYDQTSSNKSHAIVSLNCCALSRVPDMMRTSLTQFFLGWL
jgi:hypothetical protein